jgi:hypothetical protein
MPARWGAKNWCLPLWYYPTVFLCCAQSRVRLSCCLCSVLLQCTKCVTAEDLMDIFHLCRWQLFVLFVQRDTTYILWDLQLQPRMCSKMPAEGERMISTIYWDDTLLLKMTHITTSWHTAILCRTCRMTTTVTSSSPYQTAMQLIQITVIFLSHITICYPSVISSPHIT